MRYEFKAAEIMEAVVKAVKIPVTLKLRTGWDYKLRNAPVLAKIAEDIGIKMISVHGRTRCQFYNGNSDWKFISKVKNAVTIPVVANGDVTTLDDVENIFCLSQADGVMIGRGVYGKPWFLSQVIEFLKTGKRISAPPLADQYFILREHYLDMLNFYGKSRGLRIARKHMAWYTKGLPKSAEFRATINKISEAYDALNFIDQFFKNLLSKAQLS